VALTNGFFTDGGNVENLATVGPVHIDALCRQTTGNVSATSGVGVGGGKGGSGHNTPPRYPAPWLTSGGETEAQILVWTETGSLSFKGGVGPRVNIPPGPPNYNGPEASNNHGVGDDPVAGEGDHLFVAASNEETDETRGTDPEVDDYSQLNGAMMLNRYPGFASSSSANGTGVITTSTGHFLIAEMLAGFDTLGVHNACVFSGVVEPIS
jgi:hypothetical protein